jgi:hypothetical protein
MIAFFSTSSYHFVLFIVANFCHLATQKKGVSASPRPAPLSTHHILENKKESFIHHI